MYLTANKLNLNGPRRESVAHSLRHTMMTGLKKVKRDCPYGFNMGRTKVVAEAVAYCVAGTLLDAGDITWDDDPVRIVMTEFARRVANEFDLDKADRSNIAWMGAGV